MTQGRSSVMVNTEAMTPRRTWGAFVVASALVITACAGGSGDADPPIVEATSTTASPPTTTPTTTPTPEPAPAAEPVTYEQLSAQAFDGEVDELTLVLSEFAALFGVDVPGAVPLAVDSSLPTLGTDVLQAVRRLDDQLTDEQRSIINTRIDEVVGGDVVYDTSQDQEYLALFAETTADGVANTEPQGFGLGPSRKIDEPVMRGVAAQAALTFAGSLGGRPLAMTVSVAAPETAETTTLEALTEFFTIGGFRTCRITVYDRERIKDGYLVSVVGHEVFHCWQFTNASSESDADVFAGFYKEGMATWVGEQFAAGFGYPSGSNFGRTHLSNFFGPTFYDVYRSKYTAYGFWSQVAKLRGGPDALWSIIPELNAIGTDRAAVFDLALEGVDDLRRAEIAASAARHPEWSPVWDFTVVGIPADQRPIKKLTLRPGTPDERAVDPGEQAIVSFDLSGLDAGTNWVISRTNTGLTYNRLGDFDEYPTAVSEQSRYCYGESCACPDGSSVFSDLIVLPRTVTTLTVALTGSATAGASVVVDAVDVDDECDDAPTPPPLASGAFNGNGTWRATNPALARLFADASAYGFGAVPLDIAAVTGDVVMELRQDGTGTLTYTNVTAFINDSPLADLTLNGEGSFQFGVEAGLLTVSGNTFSVAVTSSAMLGESLVITDRDIEGGAGGTTTYEIGFDGDQLVLTGAEGVQRGSVLPGPVDSGVTTGPRNSPNHWGACAGRRARPVDR